MTIEEKPYSEMWMGDYPELPAKVLENGEALHSVIDQHAKQLLGEVCIRKFGGALPFLPKVLSIAKALPLQIHPNKALSEKLHQKDPEQFSDPNHKPEIAVALGPFEVFAGFKQTRDIKIAFDAVPALQSFVPQGVTGEWTNETIREVCRKLLVASDDDIKYGQEALANANRASLGTQEYILDLLPRLQAQYSKQDPGNLVALLYGF